VWLTSSQYLDALKRLSPSSASKDFHTFLGELDEAGATQQQREVDWLESLTRSDDEHRRTRAYNIQRAGDAREKIRYREKSIDNEMGVKIWKGSSKDRSERDTIEQDFTTSGTPGRLGCPFAGAKQASLSNGHRGVSTPRSSVSRGSLVGRRSKRPSFHDPIRAEVCGMSSQQPSIEGSAPLCPIRFLDQHSPEEVATYFEKHKHEIPRSHEFCVKRFQENEETLRSLDSKYANMVSMVKELGKVHQPMLPSADEIAVDDDDDGPHNPTSKVENWAKTVSPTVDDETDDITAAEDHDREQRFDRPLKDVRLGESPSRPWGIPIPEKFMSKGDSTSQKSDPTASPLENISAEPIMQEAPRGKCPFSGGFPKELGVPNGHPPTQHDATAPPTILPSMPSSLSPIENEPAALTQPAAVPQMVFNGPVFIGYPLDQAMSILKHSGFGPAN
jgi:hypothetical protein